MIRKKINIGSGQDIKPKSEGWTNLDIHDRLGADFIWDLNKLPLPFKNEEFHYVLCSHVIEDWADPTPLMDELVRITKKGGKIEFRVPYETTTWDGIFHKKPFNVITFLSYINRADYKISKMPLKIKYIKFYTSKTNFLGFLINPLFTIKRFFVVNLFNLMVFVKEWWVDYSIVKYLAHNIFLKVIYEKTG